MAPVAKARPSKKKVEYNSDGEEQEKPWYETIPHEEWDSDDHRRYAKVVKRKERGWSSD